MNKSREHIKYLVLSKEFYDSYLLLVSDSTNPANKFHAKYFLICRSIEYLLKSWLLFKGTSLQLLKNRPYGHNLEALLNYTIEKQFEEDLEISLDETLINAIVKLNQYYDSKGFEYPETGYKELPLYVQLNQPIEALHSKIEDHYRDISRRKK